MKLHIIKIGGNVINTATALDSFLDRFAQLEGPKILVHGGGKLLEELARKLDIPQQMVNGRRITDGETLKLAAMVYAGLINKQIVAALQAKGVNALGLSGADANCIPAVKRVVGAQDFGFVGDVSPATVNADFLASLLVANICPVFCAITHDGQGQLLNTNADTQASALAIALAKHYHVELVYCFEKNGVLSNPEDEQSVIPQITPSSYAMLKDEQRITEGMIPKLDNAFAAIQQGVASVRITHANALIQHDPAGVPLGTHLVA